MVGDTSAESSLCIRDLRPEQEPVPPDSTTWPKRLFQRAGLQELMLRKAVMWMPRLCRPGTGGGGEDVGKGPRLAACLGPKSQQPVRRANTSPAQQSWDSTAGD